MNQLYHLGIVFPVIVLLAFLRHVIGGKATVGLVIAGALIYLVIH